MNNLSNQGTEYFDSQASGSNLLQYVQAMNPEMVAQLSKPSSAEVFQAMERTIVTMLGNMPSEDFNVMITTNRENLGKLLVAAMINGYFLRNVEQRMAFENAFIASDDGEPDTL